VFFKEAGRGAQKNKTEGNSVLLSGGEENLIFILHYFICPVKVSSIAWMLIIGNDSFSYS